MLAHCFSFLFLLLFLESSLKSCSAKEMEPLPRAIHRHCPLAGERKTIGQIFKGNFCSVYGSQALHVASRNQWFWPLSSLPSSFLKIYFYLKCNCIIFLSFSSLQLLPDTFPPAFKLLCLSHSSVAVQ